MDELICLKSILTFPGSLSLFLALYAGVHIRSPEAIPSVRRTVGKDENGRPPERQRREVRPGKYINIEKPGVIE